MTELFLFVRPPRAAWPFNGPGSAFWPPLAFASMAAALREGVPGLRVAILDAPGLKMGWKTLESQIRALAPAYIGIGEEAVSCEEGLKVAALAKQSKATVIAGGCFFGNIAPQVLGTKLVDFVVHGEGEQTIVELVRALRDRHRASLREVRGVSFLDGEEVVFTGWRDPLTDLDALPFPAYDLLPMQNYGARSRNHPAFVSIELSRGCAHQCEFCVLWRQMSRHVASSPVACFRAKSAERALEEIRICTERYGRRYLCWVDPCFNAHPTVPRELSELLLSRGISVEQSAWVRADYLLRDAENGALDTCIRAGLNELYIGIERSTAADLDKLNKQLTAEDCFEALALIASRYPHVCTVGSFIYGTPDETPKSVRELFRFASALPLDVPIYIPLTPLPGTPYWNEQSWHGNGRTFRDHDFLPHNGVDDVNRSLVRAMVFSWPAARVRSALSSWCAPTARRRRIARRHALRSAKFLLRELTSAPQRMQIPGWYHD